MQSRTTLGPTERHPGALSVRILDLAGTAVRSVTVRLCLGLNRMKATGNPTGMRHG